MKGLVASVILSLAFVCASADDLLWMELLSSQMIEADALRGEAAGDNIPALAGELGLTTLVSFVKDAGLVDALSAPGPLTLFGPTNEAFARLPKALVKFLEKNVTVLGTILKYHVAGDRFFSSGLINEELIKSLVKDKDIRINIYGNGAVTANGRKIVKVDQNATNGVIHVISGVMFPPAGTIAFVVSKCPIFSTLLTAVRAAGLVKTLNGPGPFTLFAPSDRAFARIPEKCLDKLLEDIPLLTINVAEVLEYHVVAGTQYSAGLNCGDEVKTLEGGSVRIKKLWKWLRVNYSWVTFADGSVANGVIHVIDRVLFPPSAENFCPEGNLHYDDPAEEPSKESPYIFYN